MYFDYLSAINQYRTLFLRLLLRAVSEYVYSRAYNGGDKFYCEDKRPGFCIIVSAYWTNNIRRVNKQIEKKTGPFLARFSGDLVNAFKSL